MKPPLDTHILLWAAGLSENLSATARALIENPANTQLFSAASSREAAVKRRPGREDFQVDPRLPPMTADRRLAAYPADIRPA